MNSTVTMRSCATPLTYPLVDPIIQPKFMDILSCNEEEAIEFVTTYGIKAITQKFNDEGYQKRLIHIAATRGWPDLVEVLFKYGEQDFDVGAENQNGIDKLATPFAFAARNGHLSAMILLLEQGAKTEGVVLEEKSALGFLQKLIIFSEKLINPSSVFSLGRFANSALHLEFI